MSAENASFPPNPSDDHIVIRGCEEDFINDKTHFRTGEVHPDYNISYKNPGSQVAGLLAKFTGPDQITPFDPWVDAGLNELTVAELRGAGLLLPEEKEKNTGVKFLVAIVGLFAVTLAFAPNTADDKDVPSQSSYADRVAATRELSTDPNALQALSLCGVELRAEAALKEREQMDGAATGIMPDKRSSLLSAADLRRAAAVADTNAKAYGITCLPEDDSILPLEYSGSKGIMISVNDIAPVFDADTVCGDYLSQVRDPAPVTEQQRANIQFVQDRRMDVIDAAVPSCE